MTAFNTVFLKSLKILTFSQQLQGNVSSVAVQQGTNVFSVYQIANCNQGESNSIVLHATHR